MREQRDVETTAPVPGEVDVLLVGAGIMSATLGMLLRLVAPGLRMAFVESRGEAATESSDAWNNAGTGHAALCELNYTPEGADGRIAIDRAVKINEQFLQSRQFWATLVERGSAAAGGVHPRGAARELRAGCGGGGVLAAAVGGAEGVTVVCGDGVFRRSCGAAGVDAADDGGAFVDRGGGGDALGRRDGPGFWGVDAAVAGGARVERRRRLP